MLTRVSCDSSSFFSEIFHIFSGKFPNSAKKNFSGLIKSHLVASLQITTVIKQFTPRYLLRPRARIIIISQLTLKLH